MMERRTTTTFSACPGSVRTATEPAAEPRSIGSSKPATSVPSSRPSRIRSTRSINEVISGMGQLRCCRSVSQAESPPLHFLPPGGANGLEVAQSLASLERDAPVEGDVLIVVQECVLSHPVQSRDHQPVDVVMDVPYQQLG